MSLPTARRGLAFVLIAIIANLGQSLFSGSLWRCSDVWIESQAACVGLGSNGLERLWARNALHFDWVGHALISTFAVSTNEGWSDLMYVARDSGDSSRAVVQDVNPASPAYFTLVVLLANFICINMFRGVFINVFTRCASIVESQDARLNPSRKPTRDELPIIWNKPVEQESVLLFSSRLMGCPCVPYIPPQHRVNSARLWVFEIVDNAGFDFISILGVLSSLICMSMDAYKPSQLQVEMNEVVIIFFAAMIGSEISLRIFAMHPLRYFSNLWETLDVFVLLATYALYALRKTPGIDLILIRFVALHPFVFRGLRVLKVLHGTQLSKSSVTVAEMQMVLLSMVKSMKMYLSLFALLLIVCFIFSVAGIQIFGNLCTERDLQAPGPNSLKNQLHSATR